MSAVMESATDEAMDYERAYEALVEFLYLAPVGIIKFRPDGLIEMANPTAAQLLMPLARDGDISDIYRILADLAPDLRAHVERYEEASGQIFDQMQLVVPRSQMTLMLDVNKINDGTLMASLQNISDLTNAKRQVMKETETQRLLASVFMRINTPVVVVRADGFILMANAAFQALLGYDARSLLGLNVSALLPAENNAAARSARAQEMLDGSSREMPMDVIAKDGTRTPVLMHSTILKEADALHMRVITLIPRPMAAGPAGGVIIPAPVHSVNEVHIIDLSKIRTAIGADWYAMGSRGMDLARDKVKALISGDDILKQGKNNSFVIWFADGDARRNAAILGRATQSINHVFMTEFGTKIGDRVRAALAH